MRALLCLAGLAFAGAAHGTASENYAGLIERAREGQFAPAIERIEALRRTREATPTQLADLAQIYHWAARHRDALEVYRKDLAAQSPAWLALPMARSALAEHEPQLARRIALLAPAEGDQRYAVAAVVADSFLQESRVDEACSTAGNAVPPLASAYRAPMIPTLFSLADCEERKGDFVGAASIYHSIAELAPRQERAIRNKAFALVNAGAALLAWNLAQSNRELFTAEEMARIEHEAQGVAIRHGEVAAQAASREERVAGLDRALDVNSQALRDHAARGPAAANAARNTRYDRFIALRNRAAMANAVQLWEGADAAERDRAPAYVRVAVADAYLYLEKPRAAERLYRAAIDSARATSTGVPIAWRIGLYYALLESEQHAAAAREVEALVRETPRAIYPGIPGLEAANPEYLQVRMLHALHRLYSDRLRDAQTSIERLREEAPFSSALRAAWISLLTSRERPRAAYAEAQRLAADDPPSFEARLSLAGLAFDLQHWQEARERLQALRAEEPENKAVRRQLDALRRHESWFLRIEALVAHGGTANPRESRFDAELYSAPFATDWRAVVTQSFTPANSREGAPARYRTGAGVDWRHGDWNASAVATHVDHGARSTGADLKLSKALADRHVVEGAVEVNTRDLPVRAFVNGITADLATLRYAYSHDESRRIVAAAGGYRFSDGNRRRQASVEWRERIHSDARGRIDASLAVSGTRNSAGERPYFNPASDLSVQAGLAGEWLTWRDYARSFKQRVSLAVGSYRQHGFGALPYGDARYSHEWELRDSWSLLYGVGYLTHPYDGVRESGAYGFLTFAWYPK